MNSKLRSALFLTIALVFTLFAALQYNDPDPFIWITLYMIISLISVIAIFREIPSYILIPMILAYLIGSIYLWPSTYKGISMPMNYTPEIELARESLGLAVAALTISIIGLLSYLKRKKSQISGAGTVS